MRLAAGSIIGLALAAMATASRARTPDGPPAAGAFSLSLGGGGLVAPDYPGSNSYRLRPLPALDASYADTVFLSVQDGLGANLVNRDGFKAGPVAVYQPGRHQSDNSSALRGLGTVGDAIAVGGFASYAFGDWTARVSGVQDITDGNGGFVLNGTLSYSTLLSELIVAVTPGITAVDNRYNASFFGISEAQSRRSGLPAYDADGGLQSADLALTAIYPATEHVSILALMAYGRLLGDAAASPLVEDEGSPNQFIGGLFLTYKLY
jgi:outer membrane protein